MDIIPQVNLFTDDGGFVAGFRDPAMALFKPIKPEVLFWGSVAPSLVVARENGGDLCAWCFRSKE